MRLRDLISIPNMVAIIAQVVILMQPLSSRVICVTLRRHPNKHYCGVGTGEFESRGLE